MSVGRGDTFVFTAPTPGFTIEPGITTPVVFVPVGRPGAAGSGRVFSFPTPTTTWSMRHDLARHPVVAAWDDTVGEVEVAYTDDRTTTVIEWNVPTSGDCTIF